MELATLKETLSNGTVSDTFKIFIYTDNTFLVDQYIDEIAYKKGLAKNKLNYLTEQTTSALSLVFNYSSNLNILRVDTFDEFVEDYSIFDNTIVVCKKVAPAIKPYVSSYIVDFPKLLDWQIEDYIRVKCPGLTEQDAKELCASAGSNIYRVDSELDKLVLFSADKQRLIFRGICDEQNSDLYNFDILKIRQDLLNDKLSSIKEFLQHKTLLNTDPVGFNNLLLLLVKKILYVNFGKKANISLEEAGVSFGEAKHLKADYANLTLQRTAELLKFLSATDLKLKSNLLDMTREQLLDYVICNVIAV